MSPAALLRLLILLAAIAGTLIHGQYAREVKRQQAPQSQVSANESLSGWPALAKQVEQSRGLSFKILPTFAGVSPDELLLRQRQMVERRFADGKDALKIRADSALGFRWQPAYPFAEALSGLIQEQDGCAYDEISNTLYFDQRANPASSSSLKGKWLATLAMILDRQHFPLPATASDDGLLAQSTLTTGDARQTMLKCLMSDPSSFAPSAPAAETASAPFYATPPYFRERFLFPSAYGEYYLEAQEANKEFAGVGKALAAPPLSTSEIMHPDMPRFEPVAVKLPEIAVLGQKPVFENVAGEFQLFLLLRSQLRHEEAELASEGWRGDRYAVYAGPQAKTEVRPDDHLLWISSWASAADAQEFAETMFQFLLARHGIAEDPKFRLESGRFRVRGFLRAFTIFKDPRDEKNVIVISAATEEFADALEKLMAGEK